MSITRRTAVLAGAAVAAFGTSVVRARPSVAGRELFAAKSSDGTMISGEILGPKAAPGLLFVHGLGQSRLAWERQRDLADRFRVAFVDLRGHGASGKPEDPAAYGRSGTWADDIAAAINAAGLRRPTLVGWSFGGLVVGHYLKRHGPDGIAGVLLAAPVTKLAPELLTQRALDLGPGAVSDDLDVRVRTVEDTIAATFARPPEASLHRRMLVAGGMVPLAFHKGYGGLAGVDTDQALSAIPRLGIVAGGRDAITRPEMARRLLTLNPGATLETYADAGHAPFHDDAVRFNAGLTRFASAGR